MRNHRISRNMVETSETAPPEKRRRAPTKRVKDRPRRCKLYVALRCDEKDGKRVHAQLLHRFNLTAQQLPLLELNISDRAAPFRLAPRLTGTEYQTLKKAHCRAATQKHCPDADRPRRSPGGATTVL